jgi:16S rRNA (adenine1518-N6/adenine1519-N6)-dimethyltransferase
MNITGQEVVVTAEDVATPSKTKQIIKTHPSLCRADYV